MFSATHEPRGRALLLGLVVTAVTLAGCVNDDDETVPAGLLSAPERPEGTEDWPVIEVVTPDGVWSLNHPGPWYDLPAGELVVPALILWVNEDVAMHRMIVSARSAGSLAAGSDGHDHSHDYRSAALPGLPSVALPSTKDAGAGADHDHGDSVVIDVIVEAGESAYTALVEPGVFDVHCHPHPWMVDTWTAVTAAADGHPVVVNERHFVGAASGSLDMDSGRNTTTEWPIDAPDLVRVDALVTWDDAHDDVVDIAGTNEPDTLTVELLGPDGQVLDMARGVARSGNLTVRFETATTAWPAAVRADDVDHAALVMAGQRAPDTKWTGLWQVRVTLEDAPGLVLGGMVPVNQEPFRDGRQDWELEIVAVHQVGQVVAPGSDTTPSAEVRDWPDPAAHVH